MSGDRSRGAGVVDRPDIDVSVVTVTYRCSAELRGLLASLGLESCASTVEVLVADNRSDDDVADVVRECLPQAELIQVGYNSGFAVANNAAIRRSRGRYLLLLNPDTRVTRGAIDALARFMDSHPCVAAAGPKLLNPDSSLQYSIRNLPSLRGSLIEALFLHHLFPNALARYGEMVFDDRAYESAHAVGWVSGAAMFVRRDVLEDVGLLDESFFLYCEEIDWLKRIADAGSEVWFVPDAVVLHRDDHPPRDPYLMAVDVDSRLRYCRKHMTRAGAAAATAILALNMTLRYLMWSTASLAGRPGAPRERAAFARGLRALTPAGRPARPEPPGLVLPTGNEKGSEVSSPSYLLITPARNESEFIRRTCESVVRQTIPPTVWLIADDGSTDETPRIAEEYAARYPFIRVVDVSDADLAGSGRRLDRGVDAVVFNAALGSVDHSAFDYVGKLDADVEFEPDYYERLFAEFDRDECLGICAGHFYETLDGVLTFSRVPDWHVRGAAKLYRRECFEAVGGIEDILNWDGIDEAKAQMRGWYSRALHEPRVIHLRPTGTADGRMVGIARLGLCDYILHYHPLFVLARAARIALHRPYVAGGCAYLYGYARSCVQRPRRYDDPEVVRFIRRSQLLRLVGGRPYAMSGEELRRRGRRKAAAGAGRPTAEGVGS